MVNNDNYVVIQGFMVNELHLKGNELLIYAIIYGFSQDNQEFRGSQQYLADWTNTDRRNVARILKSLIDKELIIKNDEIINGVKFCKYRCRNVIGYDKMSQGGMTNCHRGYDNLSHNNIDNNIDNNIVIKEEQKTKRFKPPFVEEVYEYCKERNNGIDAQAFVDFYESKNWMVGKNKMKDWKACVRTWERRQKPSVKTAVKTTPNPFGDFPQREVDNDELERRLLSARH